MLLLKNSPRCNWKFNLKKKNDPRSDWTFKDSNQLCSQVLPKLDQIPDSTKDEPLDNQLETVKLLAELSPFYVVHENTPSHITSIVNCLFVST